MLPLHGIAREVARAKTKCALSMVIKINPRDYFLALSRLSAYKMLRFSVDLPEHDYRYRHTRFSRE